MIELIVVIIGALIVGSLVRRGFALGSRATEATERTAELLAAALPPEARDRYVAMKEKQADELREQKKMKAVAFVVLAIIAVFYLMSQAHAQGIYMGRDGRVHPSVIVGSGGEVFPALPTYCPGGYGPCPVFLAPPVFSIGPPRIEVVPPAPYYPPRFRAAPSIDPPSEYYDPRAAPLPRRRPSDRTYRERPPLPGPFEREPD